MKNPNPINLATSEEMRARGWQAEARDADGHLTSTHAPFDRDEDLIWYFKECMEAGYTITIWPTPKDA